MANEYLVNADDLTAVADAIRTKGGTSDALTFPDGFVDAVGVIETGGGSEIFYSFIGNQSYKLIDSSITAFKTTIAGWTGLTEIDLPNCTTVVNGVFSGCTALASVNLPALTFATYQMFAKNAIEEIVLPSATGALESNVFDNCQSLVKCDLPAITSIGKSYAFNHCHALTALILRRSDAIVSLSNVNNFNETPIGKPASLGNGYIYVPSALVDTYKAATNWSSFADYIRAIEDYPEITGG